MILISVVLSVGLTTIFAEPYYPNINGVNPRFVPQQEPLISQGDQSMLQSSMEGNQPVYPMPQQPLMQQPIMQGFQPPFLFNTINPQQMSLLMMSMYTRLILLNQLLSMQNRYQPYQLNPYSDSVLNNYGPTQVPLPYAQQSQVDLQKNYQNELLQTQQQQAEAQHKAILEERRKQREYEMENQRREELIKRQAEEDELEQQQREVERQILDDLEIKRERDEAEKQILEEERKEKEQKENDLKLRQEEELRFKKIEEEKKKQTQEKMRQKVRVIKKVVHTQQ